MTHLVGLGPDPRALCPQLRAHASRTRTRFDIEWELEGRASSAPPEFDVSTAAELQAAIDELGEREHPFLPMHFQLHLTQHLVREQDPMKSLCPCLAPEVDEFLSAWREQGPYAELLSVFETMRSGEYQRYEHRPLNVAQAIARIYNLPGTSMRFEAPGGDDAFVFVTTPEGNVRTYRVRRYPLTPLLDRLPRCVPGPYHWAAYHALSPELRTTLERLNAMAIEQHRDAELARVLLTTSTDYPGTLPSVEDLLPLSPTRLQLALDLAGTWHADLASLLRATASLQSE